MKKNFLRFCVVIFGLNLSMATNEVSNLSPEIVAADELFCDKGWADVEEYFDAGGDDGFYAGYLYCYHCGC